MINHGRIIEYRMVDWPRFIFIDLMHPKHGLTVLGWLRLGYISSTLCFITTGFSGIRGVEFYVHLIWLNRKRGFLPPPLG